MRLAKNLVRIQRQKGKGEGKGKWLDSKKRELIDKLKDGTLVREANRLAKESGHGRILRSDGSFVQIGGSTGGIVRTILNDWTPPDVPDEEESEVMMMD